VQAAPPQLRTLVIVPCGRSKVWDDSPQAGPVSARLAYTGAPFKVNREYAEHFGGSWVILSAKYGFLNPEEMIEGPYDVTFKRRSPPPIGEAALREQVRSRGLDRFDDVIGLGGRDYRIVVQATFADSNVRLHFPFAGMSLGKSLQILLAYSPVQLARVKSRRARWPVRVRSRGWPVQ
jgi:hypothetical protein